MARPRPTVQAIGLLVFMWLIMTGTYAHGQDAARQLRWKFTEGDRYVLNLTQTNVSKTAIDSRDSTVTATTDLRFDWTVLSVDEAGKATIEQSLAAIKVSVADAKRPKQAIYYDTDSNEKVSSASKKLLRQVQPLIAKMVTGEDGVGKPDGIRFLVTMTPRGKIESVTLPEEAETRINELPQALNLRALFGKQGLTELLGASNVVLPESDATETWEVTQARPTAFGEFKRTHRYSIGSTRSVDGVEFQEILLATQAEPVETDPTTGEQSSKRLKSFSGSGSLQFDLDNGYLAQSRSHNTIETETDYREKVILTTVDNSIEMTLTKKAER